ncbi:MAG: hypothetical protein JWP41_4086 [Ramlibacter sp.]|jgi:drug/metabolite transporter (DMT)-like permease|nr:hypothetical protein [Ramlibacter sp.]
MTESPQLSTAANIAISALGLCGYAGGWLIVAVGGFHHAPHRYARETTFVSGVPAVAMAVICFALAAIAVSALLQARKSKQPWFFIACGAVLLPPLACWLLV